MGGAGSERLERGHKGELELVTTASLVIVACGVVLTGIVWWAMRQQMRKQGPPNIKRRPEWDDKE